MMVCYVILVGPIPSRSPCTLVQDEATRAPYTGMHLLGVWKRAEKTEGTSAVGSVAGSMRVAWTCMESRRGEARKRSVMGLGSARL